MRRKVKWIVLSCVIALVIGGADGPTSVIVGVSRTEKKLHAACSALTFEPQKNV